MGNFSIDTGELYKGVKSKSDSQNEPDFTDLSFFKDELDDIFNSFSEVTNLVESTSFSEDSGSLMTNIFQGRDFVSNESWKKIESIHSRITYFNEDIVSLDCIIDSEKGIIENRDFPKNLFEHLHNLKIRKPILIKLSSKPGSTRIDVFSGEGIINLESFENIKKWELLENQGLDNKLTEW